MEGAGEQQAARAPVPGHRRQDLHRPPRARQLQAPQALRQQRGAQGALPRGQMGRGGRHHHLPQGIQAAVIQAVRWGLVGGHEPLLVLAAAQCAVVGVPEPGAFLPPQPGVIQLPEPHAPREPQPCLPPLVPPWPPQPAPAPGLQQQG
uniref:Uncharacterized protein n=1 Tax=Triticum urartu TaxID=4572 RepID=A0A8R7PZQ6_TRIUA